MMADVDKPVAASRGQSIVSLSWAGTIVFAVTAAAAAAVPDTLGGLAAAVDLALFSVGILAFLWAYAIAVQRSRHDAVTIGGIFLLIGSVPRRVQWRLWGSLVAQIVIAFATAGVRPFSRLAFGVLVPMFGLALCGQWGARHGRFAPRAPSSRRPSRHGTGTEPESRAGDDPVEQNARHG